MMHIINDNIIIYTLNDSDFEGDIFFYISLNSVIFMITLRVYFEPFCVRLIIVIFNMVLLKS